MLHRPVGVLVLLAALTVATIASLALGANALAPGEVLDALAGRASGEAEVVVRELRVPRTIVAVACGIGLGLAGALTQGHTRNPLADPGMLGVSAGAAFAIVLAAYLWRVTDPAQQVWFAFAGAALGAAVVFAVCAAGQGTTNPLTLILAGAGLTALLTAATTAIVLTDDTSLDAQRFWSAGSVAGRGLDVLAAVAPYLGVGTLLALASGPALTLLGLGDDSARALGVPTRLVRWGGFATITMLTGAATALAGPIAFLGLVVPHLARAIAGPDYRWILPYSALLGAVLLLVADTAGRLLAPPAEIQVGIVLAFVGAPFFVALVRRRSLVRL